MALMTVADMQTEVWDNILDVDSANRALDATTLLRILNRCYAIVRGIQDDRPYFVAANVSGASFAPIAGSGYMVLAETNYRRILEVYPAANNASVLPLGPALARWTPDDIFRMQVEDATDRGIYASAYAAWRAGTPTAASVGKWNIALWPLSSIAYDYVLLVLKEVTALSAGSDKADATEIEHHVICDMASAIGARLLGRSEEHIADIKQRIPEEFQAAAMLIEKDLRLVGAADSAEAA